MSSAREARRWPHAHGRPDCLRSQRSSGWSRSGRRRAIRRTASGAAIPATTAHEILAARSDQQVQRRASEDRLAPAAGRSGPAARRNPGRAPEQQLPLDADHGRRRALRVERRRPRRSVRPGDRQDAVGAEAGRRSNGTDAIRGSANRGVAYWGDSGRDARIITFRNRYLYALNPKTGEPIADFGNNGVVDLGADVGPRSTGYRWNSVPLIARDVIVMGSAMVDQDSASKIEGDPGDVRAYDVRTGKLRWTFHVVPTRRRCGGDQDVGRRFVAIHRRRQRLVVDERGRRARLRVSADDERHQRHVRRRAARRQLVQHVDRVPRRRHRQARLALTRPCITISSTTTIRRRRSSPTSPSTARRIKARRADHQAVVGLRARSRHRQAGVADRREAGARVNGARREGLADAAVSVEAAGVRSPGHHRRRSDRLHAGAARRSAGDLQAVPHRPGVHAAVDRRHRARRSEGHDRAAGIDRRRRLDRRGVRSRDRHALRAVDDEPVRRQPDSRRSEGRRTFVIAHRRAS